MIRSMEITLAAIKKINFGHFVACLTVEKMIHCLKTEMLTNDRHRNANFANQGQVFPFSKGKSYAPCVNWGLSIKGYIC